MCLICYGDFRVLFNDVFFNLKYCIFLILIFFFISFIDKEWMGDFFFLNLKIVKLGLEIKRE